MFNNNKDERDWKKDRHSHSMNQDDEAALGPAAFGGQHRNSLGDGEFQNKRRVLKPTSKSHVPNGKDPN